MSLFIFAKLILPYQQDQVEDSLSRKEYKDPFKGSK